MLIHVSIVSHSSPVPLKFLGSVARGKSFVNRVLAHIMPQRNCRARVSDFVRAQEIKLRISR